MSRDLAGEVEKLLKSTNSYLRKKVSEMLFRTQLKFGWHYGAQICYIMAEM